MRTMPASLVVSVLLGSFTGAAAQFPPEITVDRYLVRAEACAGQPEGAACWMELANQPEGTVKLTDLVPNQGLGKSLSC